MKQACLPRWNLKDVVSPGDEELLGLPLLAAGSGGQVKGQVNSAQGCRRLLVQSFAHSGSFWIGRVTRSVPA